MNIELSDNYFSNFPGEEGQYNHDQILARINNNMLAQQEAIDRANEAGKPGSCHGCGHLGHSRPNCPYKDYPGWIARGKRNHPLDVENVTGNEEVCHGCGHFGHSRPTCPFKEVPGYFPYGHRRVPLDLSNATKYQHQGMYNNSSSHEICHGCGHPGHNRPQCPFKELPGWVSRGQRRTPLDISGSFSLGMSQGNEQRPPDVHSASNGTDNESATKVLSGSTVTTNNGPLKAAITKYDNIFIPRLTGMLQSTLASDANNAITVSILLDPTKLPNLISTQLFNHLISMTDIAISRQVFNMTVPSVVSGALGFPSIGQSNRNADPEPKTYQLQYFVKLKLHFTDAQLSIEDEFYVFDFYDADTDDVNTPPHAFSGIQLGYYTIFQYGLFNLYSDKFTVNPAMSLGTSKSTTPLSTLSGQPLTKQSSKEKDNFGQIRSNSPIGDSDIKSESGAASVGSKSGDMDKPRPSSASNPPSAASSFTSTHGMAPPSVGVNGMNKQSVTSLSYLTDNFSMMNIPNGRNQANMNQQPAMPPPGPSHLNNHHHFLNQENPGLSYREMSGHIPIAGHPTREGSFSHNIDAHSPSSWYNNTPGSMMGMLDSNPQATFQTQYMRDHLSVGNRSFEGSNKYNNFG